MNALSRLPGLHVASRTSSFRFRGRESDIREIGRELDVAAVVEGSVRRAGSRLRVTAQLTNVADGYHLWSERYDREMADVFDIQDQIVASIVKAIAPTLAGDVKAAVKRPTENLEAYELYLKGRHYWHQRSPANLQAAIQCFEQVIALDPEYALAYAGLADCFAIYRGYAWYSTGKSRPPALAAAARAMALDPSLAEVHYSQALVTYFFERHWRAAESHLRRALSINPRLAMAQAYLGLVLASDYQFDEALVEIDRAQDIDPLSPFIHFLAAAVPYCLWRVVSTPSPTAPLAIQVALHDVDAVRESLRACIADEAPLLTLQAWSGPELDALRTDPEIDRLLDQLYDGARPRP
jgi:adenylate cyclase